MSIWHPLMKSKSLPLSCRLAYLEVTHLLLIPTHKTNISLALHHLTGIRDHPHSPLKLLSSFIHACIYISFFLWLNNLPQYEYTTFYLSSHQLMDIWVVTTFGYLNNAAMKICVHVFVCRYVIICLKYAPRSIYLKLLGHMETVCLTV